MNNILLLVPMAHRGTDTSIQLRVAVATCRLLFSLDFEAIECKTGVKADTAAKIILRAIDRAGNEDFNDVLAWVGMVYR